MFAFRPKPKTMSGRSATGASGTLLGRSATDFFDKQSIDAAPRIVARYSRQTAIDHHPHTFDSERRFRDICSHDHFALIITRQCGILFTRRQFPVKRQCDEVDRSPRSADRGNRAIDFIFHPA